jgi:hypothetical protein
MHRLRRRGRSAPTAALIQTLPTTSGKGAVADIFGRRPATIIGAIYTALCALVYFQILGAGTPWIAVFAMTAGHALGAHIASGVTTSVGFAKFRVAACTLAPRAASKWTDNA